MASLFKFIIWINLGPVSPLNNFYNFYLLALERFAFFLINTLDEDLANLYGYNSYSSKGHKFSDNLYFSYLILFPF